MSNEELELKDYKILVVFTNEERKYAQWVITFKGKEIKRGQLERVEGLTETLRKNLREIQEEGVYHLVEHLNALKLLDEINSVPIENLVASVNLRKFKHPYPHGDK